MASFFTSILYYCLLLPISYLSFGVMYRISDGLSWLMYRVFKYRKKLIMNNLRNSFPEKSEIELQYICKEFYRYLSDTMLENIKMVSVSKDEVLLRTFCNNPDVIDHFAKQNQSIILVGGHYSGFEWLAFAVDLFIGHQLTAVYKPLSNVFFDKKIKQSRSRMGLQLVAMNNVRTFLESGMNVPNAVAFAIDQAPTNPKNAHWAMFLNQDTPVLFGAEKFAKQYNLPVVFTHFKKRSRGYFEITFEVVTDTPRQTLKGQISEQATQLLEADIRQEPQYWLWSHNRWKHKR